MHLKGLYVLEIPDLRAVLNEADVIHWEVFLLHTSQRYEKIHWHISSSEDNNHLQQILVFYGRLKAAKIDFRHKRIVFYRGDAEQQEFERFLLKALGNLFIRIYPDQMHFVVTSKYSSSEKGSIMR